MVQVKAPNKCKYGGTWYATGDVIEVELEHLGGFPDECIMQEAITPNPSEASERAKLTKQTVDELYNELQIRGVEGRTRIKEQGKDAIIDAILQVREE